MKKKFFFLINHLSFFSSHRINLANELSKKFDVTVICGLPASDRMEKYGVSLLKKKKIKFKRFKIHPHKVKIYDFLEILKIYFFIKKNSPEAIHSISPRFNLIAIIISVFYRTKYFFSISGLGYIFTKKNFLNIIIQKVFLNLFRLGNFYNEFKLIVHNSHDYKIFKKLLNLKNTNILLTNGSGVELNKFTYKKPNSKKIILFCSRVLYEKGIVEFLKASSLLKKKYKKWKFIVLGSIDYKSPGIISPNLIKQYVKIVKFIGHKNDINKYIKDSSIICLPSYREGMPKVLLEASAVGRPIVTTNIPGCRDIVINNYNGYLVPSKNIILLAKKLEFLIKSRNKREIFGIRARKLAESKFSQEIINKKILKFYSTINQK